MPTSQPGTLGRRGMSSQELSASAHVEGAVTVHPPEASKQAANGKATPAIPPPLPVGSQPAASGDEQVGRHQHEPIKPRRLNFSDDNREAHLEAFYAWLPQMLHDSPGIDWNTVPSKTIGYLVRTVGTDPLAPQMAVAAAVFRQLRGHHNKIGHVYRLLRKIRTYCGVKPEDVSALSQRAVWDALLAKGPRTAGLKNELAAYISLTTHYLRTYLDSLTADEQVWMRPFILPMPPSRFVMENRIRSDAEAEEQERRKEQSDILVPLYPVLVALVQLRYQAGHRFIEAYRAACREIAEGRATLPFAFSYEETIPEINRDARTIAEACIVGRPVTMRWVLWERRSWVQAHAEHYDLRVRRRARLRRYAYSDALNEMFLEFTGPAEDLLWFGDLVANDLFHEYIQTLRYNKSDRRAKERLRLQRLHGAGRGFRTTRSGVLGPHASTSVWLRKARDIQPLLVMPESLYRGILFGAAMLLICLTNGCRVSELLQISCDRFQKRTVPIVTRRGDQRIHQQQTIYLQLLLPKGHHTEQSRQLFPISRMAMMLLEEIAIDLRQAHAGKIPVVRPSGTHTKVLDLHAERYLFQWASTADGRIGALNSTDVNTLLRFVLHGVEVTTAKGERILVSTHLLRHVFATAARHTYSVPVEAIAWVLHHSQRRPSGSTAFSDERDGIVTPVATEYYSREPEEQSLARIQTFQLEVELEIAGIGLVVPTERDLEMMNQDLQNVFARWHTLHPTVFGLCGCPNLCPRGIKRSLCLGCSYLIPNPDKLEDVATWRASYAQQVAELEAAGAIRDLLEARKMVQDLDDLANVMQLQRQAEADRHYVPFFRTLPHTSRSSTPNAGAAHQPPKAVSEIERDEGFGDPS